MSKQNVSKNDGGRQGSFTTHRQDVLAERQKTHPSAGIMYHKVQWFARGLRGKSARPGTVQVASTMKWRRERERERKTMYSTRMGMPMLSTN